VGLKEEFLKSIDMEALAKEFAPIISSIIRQKKYDRVHYSTHDYEDLENVGYIGLIEALGRYDPSVGDFENFARVSIRGKIGDFTRKESHTTRSGRSIRKKIALAEKDLTEILGRSPNQEELAEELGITVSKLGDMRISAAGRSYVSVESGYSTVGEESSDLIENLISLKGSFMSEQAEGMERKQVINIIAEEIEGLPLQEKTVLKFWIHDSYKLKEISEAMKLTPSRASQIKTNAIKILKERFSCRT